MTLTVPKWQRWPVDDVGYITPDSILGMTMSEVLLWTRDFEIRRYSLERWRNWKGLWRETLGLDTTMHSSILDYGCGFGIEALQFARNGNEIYLADTSESILQAANYVLTCHGYSAAGATLLNGDPTQRLPNVDIFYANGVLHHTPLMPDIMQTAAKYAEEARLLLYSDLAWIWKTGTQPPRDTGRHPFFKTFVRAMDDEGEYADWYNAEKLWNQSRFWDLTSLNYITEKGLYLTATLQSQ